MAWDDAAEEYPGYRLLTWPKYRREQGSIVLYIKFGAGNPEWRDAAIRDLVIGMTQLGWEFRVTTEGASAKITLDESDPPVEVEAWVDEVFPITMPHRNYVDKVEVVEP